jgi:hypothetical protein
MEENGNAIDTNEPYARLPSEEDSRIPCHDPN